MNKRTRLASFLGALALTVSSVATAATFNLFQPANGILKGNPSTYVTTAAASSDVIALWSGTCSASTFLRGDGSCQIAGTPPGGTSGQLQYNNAGAFNGANISYDLAVGSQPRLTFNGANGVIASESARSITAQPGASGALILRGGPATGDNTGGSVQVSGGGGSGTGSAGSVSIATGTGGSGTNGNISFLTAGVNRLTVDYSGAWNLASNPGTSGQVFTSNGAGAAPTWQAAGGGDATLAGNNTWTGSNIWEGTTLLRRSGGSGSSILRIQSSGQRSIIFDTAPSTPSASIDDVTDAPFTGLHLDAKARPLWLWAGGNQRLVIDADGSWDLGGSSPGTAGQVLTSNGAGAAPTWQAGGGGGASLSGNNTFTGTNTFSGDYTTGGRFALKGNAAGVSAVAYAEFQDSTGAAVGYVGDGSGSNADISLAASQASSNVLLVPGAGGGAYVRQSSTNFPLVTSPASAPVRVFFAKFNGDCTGFLAAGFSSCSRSSAGAYDLAVSMPVTANNYACTGSSTAAGNAVAVTNNSSTFVSVGVRQVTTGTAVDSGVSVTCMAP